MTINSKTILGGLAIVVLSVLLWHFSPHWAVGSHHPWTSVWLRLLSLVIFWGVLRLLYNLVSGRFGAAWLDTQESARFNALKQQLTEVIAQVVKRPWTKAWAIYRMPWYMVVGDAGVGKTTLLDQSGMSFRWRSVSQRPLQGSNDCDWYISDRAVFLDVSAHLSQVADGRALHQTAWWQFLRLLNRLRRLRPLNGIIVTVSASQLLSNTPEQQKQQAERIRRTIETVQQHSLSRVPVYLVLAKADSLPGFAAFFNGLKPQRRQQVLGVTFAQTVSAPHKDTLDSFEEHYQALLKQLSAAIMPNLPREKAVATNLEAFHFPRFLATLKNSVHDVLEQGLFFSSYFRTIYLRGFYWTALVTTAPRLGQSNQNSYFMKELFEQVILPEATLGSIGQRFVGMLNTIKRSMCIAVVLLTALLVMVWVAGFSRGQFYVAQTENNLSHYQYLVQNWQQQPFAAEPAYDALHLLWTMKQARAAQYQQWWRYLGFPFPSTVDQSVQQLYQNQLQVRYQPFVVHELADGLRTTLNNQPEVADSYQQMQYWQTVYGWLSAYLMFQEPEHMNSHVVESQLQNYWQTLYQSQPNIAEQFSILLRDLLAAPLQVSVVDTDLVANARQQLGDAPISAEAYFALKTKAEHAEQAPLMVGGDAGSNVLNFAELNRVPHFFTLAGYQGEMANQENPALQQAAQEKWVLARTDDIALSDDVLAENRDQLQLDYWSEYAHRWQAQLNSITVIPSSNLDTVTKQLQWLAGAQSPLTVLLQQLDHNTSSRRLVEAGADAVGLETLQTFAPINQFFDNSWATWQQNLAGLSQLLSQIDSATNPQEAAYETAVKIAQGQVPVLVAWQQDLAQAPAPVQGWLQQVMANSINAIAQSATQYLQQQWNTRFATECQQSIDNHYPIAVNANESLSPAQLRHYFGHSAALVQFVSQKLLPLINTTNSQWTAQEWQGMGLGMTPALLSNAESIMAIHRGYFEEGQNTPGFTINITPQVLSKNLASFNMQYAGQVYQYANGPQQTQAVTWSDTSNDGLVTVQYVPLAGAPVIQEYPGLWGVVRWLRSAEVTNATAQSADLSFNAGYYQADYRVSLTSPRQNLQDILVNTPIQCIQR